MSDTQSSHAESVVESFKSMLSDDAKGHISEAHFGELALLIEAAIDASLVDQAGRASSIAEAAAEQIKKL